MSKLSPREMEKRKREVDFAISINEMNNVDTSQGFLDLCDAYIEGSLTVEQAKIKIFKRRT